MNLLIRAGTSRYFDVQVKSARDYGLVILPRRAFEPRENLLAAVVVFVDEQPPASFLIPSTDWEQRPGALLFYYRRHHKDPKRCFDEYQLRMGKAQRDCLRERYSFIRMAQALGSE